MILVRTPEELERAIGNRPYPACGFVPTMGALHEGHFALIRRAAKRLHPVVLSTFVNPTQFGPGEDYQRYPRTPERDRAAAASAGADILFAPPVEVMYPNWPQTDEPAQPPLPEAATRPGLEDRFRPGHFAGVCQVVARLFDLVFQGGRPGVAVFGEKDYQQLLVIDAMVRAHNHRWPGLSIIAHPTVREPDGLALSSRNQYLSADQRRRALAIPRALRAAAGASTPGEAENRMNDLLSVSAAELEVDYAVVRDGRTLQPLPPDETPPGPARALIAARVDSVRLIDNEPMTFGDAPQEPPDATGLGH